MKVLHGGDGKVRIIDGDVLAVTVHGPDPSELEKNARLFAAAPRMFDLLTEVRRTLEMWKDVAPAVSLCADIDKLLNDVRA